MALKMILEAQIRSRLTPNQITRYSELAQLTGRTLVEVAQEMDGTIQPEDYQEWLRVIGEVGEEEGLDLSKRAVFYDTAFEVLDNDPKMDMIGGSEGSKLAICKTLWHAYNVAQSHNAVGQVPPDEENEEASVEGNADMDLMSTVHSSVNLQKVYRNGVSVGQSDVADGKSTKSQYQRGTKRDKVWKLGHKHGTAGK